MHIIHNHSEHLTLHSILAQANITLYDISVHQQNIANKLTISTAKGSTSNLQCHSKPPSSVNIRAAGVADSSEHKACCGEPPARPSLECTRITRLVSELRRRACVCASGAQPRAAGVVRACGAQRPAAAPSRRRRACVRRTSSSRCSQPPALCVRAARSLALLDRRGACGAQPRRDRGESPRCHQRRRGFGTKG